jgi:hypothetical protein
MREIRSWNNPEEVGRRIVGGLVTSLIGLALLFAIAVSVTLVRLLISIGK